MQKIKWLMRTTPANKVYNRFFNRDNEDILILSSIPKSGVTYLRYILANYLLQLDSPGAPPITYKVMHEELFPNRKRFSPPLGLRQPSPLMRHLGCRDIYNTHVGTEHLRYSRANIVFLYRNPLDNLVSRFFYFYKYRPDRQNQFTQPREIIDIELPKFIEQFNQMREVWRTTRALPVAYECLLRASFQTIYTMLQWIDAPIDVEKLKQALEMSDFKVVRKEEEAFGPIGYPREGFQGFFTRSGAIGQWQDHFDAADVDQISSMLSEAGISLNQFILR